ncbi:MAG: hypothetical protein H8D87_21025 [Deltaproteobacteria bacterium]|uniref:hypothetical protein n=1 Tax=Desulfobacula sp. TaxID=2593537 RepID=UPI0019CC721D|nr:hypothetical protein [Candidatus Desulfobacula maris]MBL6992540.1 hypothetical protein [Desulfobacula sp.]
MLKIFIKIYSSVLRDFTDVLPPPMAGFFEFSMMRVRHDIDQKVLGELFYQYLNVEEDFILEGSDVI